MLTKVEEDFHNRVDSMNCYVDSCQPFPPDTPVTNQWAHEQSVHGSKDASDAET